MNPPPPKKKKSVNFFYLYIYLLFNFQDLPKDIHLDGELFGGRKKFQQTIKVVKNAECADWNKIKYCVGLVFWLYLFKFKQDINVSEKIIIS